MDTIGKKFRQRGYNVISTDIQDFNDSTTMMDALNETPDAFDCVITNPPFNKKYEFIERFINIDIPFALLLPLEMMSTKKFKK